MVLLREAQLVVATAFKCSSTLELALVNVDAALRLLREVNGAEVTTYTKADANTSANLDFDVLLADFINLLKAWSEYRETLEYESQVARHAPRHQHQQAACASPAA